MTAPDGAVPEMCVVGADLCRLSKVGGDRTLMCRGLQGNGSAIMGGRTAQDPAARAFEGILAELAAADELITELVAENEELRSRLSLNHEHEAVPPPL